MITIHAEFLENIYNLNSNKRQKTTWFFVYFCKLVLHCILCQFFRQRFIYILFNSNVLFRTILLQNIVFFNIFLQKAYDYTFKAVENYNTALGYATKDYCQIA